MAAVILVCGGVPVVSQCLPPLILHNSSFIGLTVSERLPHPSKMGRPGRSCGRRLWGRERQRRHYFQCSKKVHRAVMVDILNLTTNKIDAHDCPF